VKEMTRKSRISGVLVTLIVLTMAIPLNVQAGESNEPNAAELVCAVRQSEKWIHKAESFFISVESSWKIAQKEKTPEWAHSRRSYKDDRVDPNRQTDTHLYRRDFFEFAVERNRLYLLEEEPERSRTVQIWDGKEALSNRQDLAKARNQCYRASNPEKVFKDLFARISWLRSQPHSFWFDPVDVDVRLKYFGYPEEFVVIDRQTYRGVDCHVLGWRHRKGLYAAAEMSKRWYVGAKDRLLYGLATLRNNKVDSEHFTLCYREIAPGCWFPMIQGYEVYDHDKEGNHYLKSRRKLRVLTVRINAKLPEELFRIEPKNGFK
jgi:hypothetical protein